MNKRNLGVGILIIVIVVVGAYLLFHKSNNDTTASNSSSTSSQQSSGSGGAKIVQTKTDPATGEFLADSQGRPLYTYGGDSNGVSNCTGACLTEWPIYAATSSSASLPSGVTIVTRSDGNTQYAYKGLPLYYFTNDGSTPTGDGISNFHLAKP